MNITVNGIHLQGEVTDVTDVIEQLIYRIGEPPKKVHDE